MRPARRGWYVALGTVLGFALGMLTFGAILDWRFSGQLPFALLVSLGLAALMAVLAWFLGEKFLDWLAIFPHW